MADKNDLEDFAQEDDKSEILNAENEFQTVEEQFLAIEDFSSVDVLDEGLYGYDSVIFSLTPVIQNRTSDSLLEKVNQFVNFVPAALKSEELIQPKTEYFPRFDLATEEIKRALRNGAAEFIPCKDSSDNFFLQIRTTVKGLLVNGKEYGLKKIIKDIPLGVKRIPTDMSGAMMCLSMQNQLNQVAQGLRELSEACVFSFDRIIQGQRDDRLAKLYSSRSCFIQAISMSDELLQRQMLLQAVNDANSARARLALQIKSDIWVLSGNKSPKNKTMNETVNDINTAIIAMNTAVQITLYAFQTLGERNAQLTVVKEHEAFIKQVLLKEIEVRGSKTNVWKLVHSSGNSRVSPQDFGSIPEKLLASCDAFIGNNYERSAHQLDGDEND